MRESEDESKKGDVVKEGCNDPKLTEALSEERQELLDKYLALDQANPARTQVDEILGIIYDDIPDSETAFGGLTDGQLSKIAAIIES